MTLNEKIMDSVSKTTGIRCFEGMPPDGIVGRFAYFFPLRSGAAKRYNEVAIFFMERPVFTPLSPEKATNDCRYLALNWLNGLYAYSGLKFQDILSQNNTRDGFGGYGVGLRLVLVDEARNTGGGATPVDKKNYFRITHDGGNGNLTIEWVGGDCPLECRLKGDTEWVDFSNAGIGNQDYCDFRLKEGTTWSATSNSKHFSITATGAAGAVLSGNIMSLVDPTLETTSLSMTYCFRSLFRQCTAIVDASELELADNTWGYCYAGMFFGCTNLETAPELPASSMSSHCYNGMFNGCTSLTEAPELPATTLAQYCYSQMFSGCTAITSAPELPAETLAQSCYSSMFYGCTSLTEAPELPAETVAQNCYTSMFSGCTALTSAPELPALTLYIECYQYMFNGCTNLVDAPSVLPATRLANYCYDYMFQGCTSLETAPRIVRPTSVGQGSYNYMFIGCSSLNSVTVEFIGWPSINSWMQGVSSTGTFQCPDDLSIVYDKNHIPTGWRVVKPTMYNVLAVSGDQTMGSVTGGGSYAVGDTVTLTATALDGYNFVNWTVNDVEVSTSETYTFTVSQAVTVQGNFEEVQLNYLTFTSLEDNSSVGWYASKYPNLDYSTDGSTWTAFTEPVSADTGDKIMFRNNGTAWTGAPQYNVNTYFTTVGTFNLSGNIMSLVDATMETTTISVDRCFQMLFSNCGIVSASELDLSTATLAYYCYANLFNNCASLTTAPALPATTLAQGCYRSMFYGCTSLTSAPALPATTLPWNCYEYMFYGCTSLTVAPELPATTTVKACYNRMFKNCINLSSIRVGFTAWVGSNEYNSATYEWVDGVAATGDFYCPSGLPSITGTSRIPTGWTRHNID